MIRFDSSDVSNLTASQAAVWEAMVLAIKGYVEAGERYTFTLKGDPANGTAQYTVAGKGCFLQLKASAYSGAN